MIRVFRILSSVLCAPLILATLSTGAAAQSVPESFWGAPRFATDQGRSSLSVTQQKLLLLWTGFYYGTLDDRRSTEFKNAVKRFQASLNEAKTGRLTEDQSRTLRQRAARAEKKADFQTVADEWTGMRLDLPMGYLSDGELNPSDIKKKFPNVYFQARGSSGLSVDLVRFEGFTAAPRAVEKALVEILKENKEIKDIDSTTKGEFVRISTREGGNVVIRVLQRGRKEYRGALIRYPEGSSNIFAPIQRKILSSAQFFYASGLNESQRQIRVIAGQYPGRQDLPEWMRTMQSSGSGSVVSYDGHILTNYHVVRGCQRLTVNSNESALLAVDIVNDLALLRSDFYSSKDAIRFRKDAAQLGEEVMVLGYPLFNNSRAINLTTGVVSAQVGLRGDRRNIQITAPVQPGNSGGPVLDRDGRQVAVVVTKLSARVGVLQNAENIAWVIRDDVAKKFLKENGVKPLEESDQVNRKEALVDVVKKARRVTVRIECHKS